MSAFATNPLLQDWSASNYGMPPFQLIKPSMFEEALHAAMEAHVKEVAAIVDNADAPSFQNTILALDKAGSLLGQVGDTFSNMCSSVCVPELQEVEMKMASPLASHYNRISNYPGLFEKINKLYVKRNELNLDSVQCRLIERFHLDLVRAGAKFSAEDKAKYEQIVEELASLQTKFTQNVMADEGEVYLTLDSEADLQGLPADLIASATQAGAERSLSQPIITLSRSLIEPFLTFSEQRELREKAWRLWTSRGELDAHRSNLPIAQRILALRQQQARMHSHPSYASYATADTMAGCPAKVEALLEEVWGRAKGAIASERGELERYMQAHGQDPSSIEAWDWRYYAEKVRRSSYALDMEEVKAYLPLSRMVAAIFKVAERLFNLRFVPRPDIPAYHPDVTVYEVYRGDELQALFLHDNYARPFKHSGAWMSELRTSHTLHGQRVLPIVCNNNNFNKPSGQGECLCSYDDALTLFHEFGHGLHGMMSNVEYKRLASTNVLKDFVELPSQLMEHWLGQEQVLGEHARHVRSQAAMPSELLHRLHKARSFGQAFATVEYTASALLDARLHALESYEGVQLGEWEEQQLKALDMPKAIVMRHRLPHFQHIFSGESYAAGYYVYLWASVLDADAFDAFSETGDCFDASVAERALRCIYSAGNSKDPAQLFRDFRGRDPVIEPMLKMKGLL